MRSEWNKTALSEIASFTTGKLNSNASVENGKYPFFTCSPETLRINDYAFDQAAILLAGNNAEGNFNIKFYSGKFNAYQRTYVFSAKNNCNLKYLYYSLRLCLDNFKRISQGTATKFLTAKILNSFEIMLPSIDTQKRIAAILSAIDDKIAEINPDTYSPKEKWEFVNYLDTSSITNGVISEIQMIYPNTEKLPSRARRIIKANDIVYSTVRPTQFHFGIIGNPMENMLASTGFAVIRSKHTYISSPYLYHFLTSPFFIEKMQQLAEQSTSTFPSVKSSDIGNCMIPCADKEEMLEITEQVANMYAMVSANHQENRRLAKLRDTLLPKLMNGEIDVSQVHI